MSKKIAVATTDGKVVNEHFGRCRRFLVLEVDEEENILSSETRNVIPVCRCHEHDENELFETSQGLSDCEYVLCARIGQGAQNCLEAAGIKSFEIPGIITESVHRMLSFEKAEELICSFFGQEVV